MEFLCAILTAVFFWLLIYDCNCRYRARALRKAGRLLLKLDHAGEPPFRIFLTFVIALAVFSLVLVPLLESIRHKPLTINRAPHSSGVFIGLCVAFGLIYKLRVLSLGFELRENGIFAGSSRRVAFAPWNFVEHCEWKPNVKKWFIQYSRLFIQYTETEDHTELPIRSEQVEAANAILTQYVEVRDDDDLACGESNRRRANLDTESATVLEPEIRDWQFSLRTLLLFLLVCSSAFSWWGVRMRNWEQQRQAIAQFEEMQPSVTYSLNDVVDLDFSACTIRPTDKDLVHLTKLPRLRRLNLSNTPITDAGLKHLEGITSLRFIDLNFTQVSNEGVERLQQAIPGVEIRYIRWF